MAQPASSFSIFRFAVVLMLSGVRFAPPSWADSAIEKQEAWAAAISSSGLVPGAFSNRVVNEYGTWENTPLGAENSPLPSLRPPFQTALALRSIIALLAGMKCCEWVIVDEVEVGCVLLVAPGFDDSVIQFFTPLRSTPAAPS